MKDPFAGWPREDVRAVVWMSASGIAFLILLTAVIVTSTWCG